MGLKFLTSCLHIKIAHLLQDPGSARDHTDERKGSLQSKLCSHHSLQEQYNSLLSKIAEPVFPSEEFKIINQISFLITVNDNLHP